MIEPPRPLQTSLPTSPLAPTLLHEQVADAVRDNAVPISRLLRLMWALDAEPGPVDERLRRQLRARIGAPLAS